MLTPAAAMNLRAHRVGDDHPHPDELDRDAGEEESDGKVHEERAEQGGRALPVDGLDDRAEHASGASPLRRARS